MLGAIASNLMVQAHGLLLVTLATYAAFNCGQVHATPLNKAGHLPQDWCGAWDAARSSPDSWYDVSIPTQMALGNEGVSTCQISSLPDALPDTASLVEIRSRQMERSGVFQRRTSLFLCDGGLKFLMTLHYPHYCHEATPFLLASCTSLQWVSSDPRLCSPPGLSLGNVGDIRAAGKQLVMQVYWEFEADQKPTLLSNATLQLGFSNQGLLLPSVGQLNNVALSAGPAFNNYQALRLPAGEASHTERYTCSRRCSFEALRGGLSLPIKPVKLIGYGFNMHLYGTKMTIYLTRCHNNHKRVQDETWEVHNYDPLSPHTYELPRALDLYPGDSFEFECTYNTTNSDSPIEGGHRFSSEEACMMQAFYWPAHASYNGCAAGRDHESFCFSEIAEVIKAEESKYGQSPSQTFLDPKSLSFTFASGWKASWLFAYITGGYVVLAATDIILRRLSVQKLLQDSTDQQSTFNPFKQFGSILYKTGCNYKALSMNQQRNVCTYVLNLVFQTAAFFWMGHALVIAWCSCGDTVMSVRDLQMSTAIISALYITELIWRPQIDSLVVVHHLIYCLILITVGMEYTYQAYQSVDALLVLPLTASAEQPIYVAMLLYRLAPGWKGTLYAFDVCNITNVLRVTGTVMLAIYFMVARWHLMQASWIKPVYIILWVVLTIILVRFVVIMFQVKARYVKSLEDKKDEGAQGAGLKEVEIIHDSCTVEASSSDDSVAVKDIHVTHK